MTRAVVALLLLVVTPMARAAESNVIATVPLTFIRGQAMVSAQINSNGPYALLLDTGFSMTTLKPDVAEKLQLNRVGEITVQGIAGEERASTYEGAVFQIGAARYEPRRLGAMAATRRRRDGIIGSGFFRQYVVRMDPAAKTLTLFSPTNFTYSGKGEVVPLRFRRSTTPVIDASIRLTNGTVLNGAFEIDTGCDSGVCVASDFARTNNLLDVDTTTSGTKLGVGGGATTRSGHLPQLQIGAVKVAHPETEFFLEGSPAGRGLAGHIGMEVLNRFRIYYDYARQRMILEPLDAK
jgi:predicted aspartyl protease